MKHPTDLMQLAVSNPEWFLFRVSTIITTAFVFVRWVAIEAINSRDEIRRRREEAELRKAIRHKNDTIKR